jgi:hypothetical protein
MHYHNGASIYLRVPLIRSYRKVQIKTGQLNLLAIYIGSTADTEQCVCGKVRETVKHFLFAWGRSLSTELATYSIFREAVQSGNQDTFVANIVYFVTKNGLEGIDIDWECKLSCT